MTDKETEQTGQLLQSLAEKHAIIVIEHDMEFVRALGAKVTVLHEGSVLAEGTYAEVSKNPKVLEAYVGSDDMSDAHH